jgi:hypothetical protein
MPSTDLRTLLLGVADARARSVAPRQLARQWRGDRFVRPASTDPRGLARLEARLWDLIPDMFEGVELSPVAPLGTSSSMGPVSQRKVVTTMRLTEVVSDSTNALALEAASRRSLLPSVDAVHLAACHRQLRAQLGDTGTPHFRLLALVSSARDQGSGRTEAALLIEHLRVWSRVLSVVIPHHHPAIAISSEDGVHLERLHDTVLPRVSSGDVPITLEPRRITTSAYYRSTAIRLTAGGGSIELGDGGITDWTAQLMSDAKERCMISCISTERVLALTQGPPSERR